MPVPINLLPPEVARRATERRIFQAVLAAGIALVVAIAIMSLFAIRRESREKEKLAAEQAVTAGLRAEAGRLQQYEDLSNSVTQRRATLATGLTNDVSWSKFLNDLSLIMPDNSWLVNMSLSASAATAPNGVQSFGSVTFAGFVFDFPGLAGWLTRMTQLDGLTFVYLGNGSRQTLDDKEVVNFSANASVTQSLLSLRCQTGRRCP